MCGINLFVQSTQTSFFLRAGFCLPMQKHLSIDAASDLPPIIEDIFSHHLPVCDLRKAIRLFSTKSRYSFVDAYFSPAYDL